MATPELSVIIPVYNEAAVIVRTVEEVAAYLQRSGIAHEIIVVDDGSEDGTLGRVHAVTARLPALRVLAAPHRGKGAAVKRGMLHARGRYRLFMDADHATRIDEWAKCGPWLRDGHPVVIGSRKIRGAEIQRRQSSLREAMGKVFTRLANIVLGARVTDITCGFKGFHEEAAGVLFQLQRIDGWGFDAEILFLARRLGYAIQEVPVVWRDDPRTKVVLVRDALRSFRELLMIRWGAWRGRYGR